MRAKCEKHHTVWEIRNGNGIKEEFVIPAISGNGEGIIKSLNQEKR
jgi:hypothetical protein